MQVKNLGGTSERTCKCGSWLNHWMAYGGGRYVGMCKESVCRNQATVGAHVQKVGTTDMSHYIVPLCQEHNQQEGVSIKLMDGTVLVPANVSGTCG